MRIKFSLGIKENKTFGKKNCRYLMHHKLFGGLFTTFFIFFPIGVSPFVKIWKTRGLLLKSKKKFSQNTSTITRPPRKGPGTRAAASLSPRRRGCWTRWGAGVKRSSRGRECSLWVASVRRRKTPLRCCPRGPLAARPASSGYCAPRPTAPADELSARGFAPAEQKFDI